MTETNSTSELFQATPVLPMLLRFHKSTIESEINLFKDYIIDSRNGITKQQEAFSKMIEEQIAEQPENRQEVLEWYEDQFLQYNEFYPATFNNSTFLSLYSFFEFNLKYLCEIIHKHRRLSISLEDLSGQNYIEKSRKYLTLVALIQLDDLSSKWDEIAKFQKLRNSIVHNNSSIKKDRKKAIDKQPLYQIVQANSNLKLNSQTGIFIISDDKFLLDLADVIMTYLVSIISKLEAQKNIV